MRIFAALLLAALLAPVPVLAGFGPGRQVLAAAALDSIDPLEDALELLETEYEPGDTIDAVTEGAIAGLLDAALVNTDQLLDAVAAEPELAGRPDRDVALGFGENAIDQMLVTDLVLDGTKPVKAGRLHDAIEEALDLHAGLLTAVQGRPRRFVVARALGTDVEAQWGELHSILAELADHGVPNDRTALFESFQVRAKPPAILERAGFTADLGIGCDFKRGVLGLRGAGKEPATGGVRFGVGLPEQFTLLVSLALPEKLRSKQLAALAGTSAGVYLASDAGPTPASSFVVEHQLTPQGFAQSFVAQGPNVVETFPLGTPSLERRLRTVVVKDADSIRLGLIQRDGEVEALHDVELPFAGSLPFLSLYVRNATKKARVEFDDLLIFVQPYAVAVPE